MFVFASWFPQTGRLGSSWIRKFSSRGWTKKNPPRVARRIFSFCRIRTVQPAAYCSGYGDRIEQSGKRLAGQAVHKVCCLAGSNSGVVIEIEGDFVRLASFDVNHLLDSDFLSVANDGGDNLVACPLLSRLEVGGREDPVFTLAIGRRASENNACVLRNL
jgi:hypothetical protein